MRYKHDYDNIFIVDTPKPAQRLLPSWCWWLAVLCSCGDVCTTLIGARMGIVDRNPLYAHPTAPLPWLLLVTHAALLLLLAVIARLHRRVGIVGALSMVLVYLPAVVINLALIVTKVHVFLHLH